MNATVTVAAHALHASTASLETTAQRESSRRSLPGFRPVAIDAAAEGAALRRKYGPSIGWAQLSEILRDRSCVRYPCEIRFEADPLLPGEFAHALPNGSKPEDGYTIYVHPHFRAERSAAPYLVLHQLMLVNYGHAATAEDAESFGAAALGLSKEEYFQALCQFAEQLGGDDLA